VKAFESSVHRGDCLNTYHPRLYHWKEANRKLRMPHRPTVRWRLSTSKPLICPFLYYPYPPGAPNVSQHTRKTRLRKRLLKSRNPTKINSDAFISSVPLTQRINPHGDAPTAPGMLGCGYSTTHTNPGHPQNQTHKQGSGGAQGAMGAHLSSGAHSSHNKCQYHSYTQSR
jgi:hypothetical protein